MTTTTTGLIPNWYPPNRTNYNLILTLWQFFPLAASLQWLIPWYGMGKTSVTSRLNLPGRLGWLTMEVPGFLTLLYHLRTLPSQIDADRVVEGGGLPWQNKLLGGLFVLHYLYRAVVFPFLQPSMSPLHVLIWGFGVFFQVTNGLAIGGWLAGYGPATQAEWAAATGSWQFVGGVGVFFAGLAANYWHDDALREIRRRAARRAASGKTGDDGKKSGAVDKVYEIPQAGLFKVMLYPHYFVEWVEWFGFWMAAGWGCVPARCFLFNEIAAMLPRAVSGRKWYVEKFGEEKIRGRWAVIPGVW
ncbi:3-oxo-5-alpha-steroid 4-dehydrogenase-domain-containing protein [Chaetomium tenue]|uniref:3-oxo-5-alpha-steroid 4-dehydrogenase-domain-containing protein n=1 Tax=Chaetomium tenue TaxID=1854479 RepID=A0ACB7NWT8_9PEZI|nr:3-oxo-5-alpha-steroid 4-dehydrogenase-domain-containing protein [Chaetomium globosum]